MKDDTIGLSRRKILGGLGAVGLASAGAGLGTTAYFNDTESFDNNTLTAGALDLKVDWEEHYSFPQYYGFPDPTDGLTVRWSMPEEDDTTSYTPLPDPANPLVWVATADLDAYMDNTAIESYPDTDGDGSQDLFDATTNEVTVGDVCTDGADLSADLDPTAAGSLRTDNADTYSDGSALPLVNLQDVKPGDFGELTLSFHLCDNPGYVWFQGQPTTAAEGGHTEPEANDVDESGAPDESYDITDGDTVSDILDSDVELLSEIQTVLWYDDGDNVLGSDGETSSGKVDIAFLHDRSGSMGNEAAFLENNIGNVATQLDNSNLDAAFGLIAYEDNGDGDSTPTIVTTDITTDSSQLDFNFSIEGGTENASEAIEFALDNLTWRQGAKKILVVITDEDDDGSAAERTSALNRIDNENACLLAVSPNTTGADELKTMSEQVQCGDWINITDGLSTQILNDLVGFITTVGGEEVIFRGSLLDTLTNLSSGNGIPLDGDESTPFDELNDPETSSARECYQPLTTNYIGFAWWLPPSVDNEVQSDSIGFDLGFYTEQCRHNEGAGPEQTA
ncbi:hypothetical protein Z052_12230 [Halorubrum sp. C191]|uniref:VWA domain-containing protein n=1 Tax=Halorubrum sp. C191 TaxID=1383842 RepID=UPI000C0857BA|nr:VWA domain-containing protein [Halorubrum sp. C191]PHQ41930.1 hypothetical protein Z052_12230 [Halorubrum sp. C191]